jgi:hypothetical protein
MDMDMIEKTARFGLQELIQWIFGRLKGKDPYFPIRKEDEQKKFELIAEAYSSIRNEDFLDNFHQVIIFLCLARIPLHHLFFQDIKKAGGGFRVIG